MAFPGHELALTLQLVFPNRASLPPARSLTPRAFPPWLEGLFFLRLLSLPPFGAQGKKCWAILVGWRVPQGTAPETLRRESAYVIGRRRVPPLPHPGPPPHSGPVPSPSRHPRREGHFHGKSGGSGRIPRHDKSYGVIHRELRTICRCASLSSQAAPLLIVPALAALAPQNVSIVLRIKFGTAQSGIGPRNLFRSFFL